MTEFLDALRRVAAGGTALDPEVVAQLLLRRGADPASRLRSAAQLPSRRFRSTTPANCGTMKFMFDLANPVQRYMFHMTVLTSGITRDRWTSWLNGDLLRGDWPRLGLPRPLRLVREDQLLELGR